MYGYAAWLQVVATLKQLASAGHTVVCSIHQPRSSIFGLFDDLLLLSEGRCVYSGPAEEALPYFEQVGLVSWLLFVIDYASELPWLHMVLWSLAAGRRNATLL